MTAPGLTLASASPRRSDILTRLGLAHDVLAADIDEDPLPGERPGPHVERLAREKAAAVAADRPDRLVLAGDTVVVADDRILGKPADADEAVAMLMRLSGRAHEVLSGLALALPGAPPALVSRADRTVVRFRDFDERWARAYVATGEPMDKAGAYGIQGAGGALVTAVEGDYTTVVGLSIAGLMELLREGGWDYRFGTLHPRDRRLPED
ncbi:Maf family protein [Gaopeijia maritima]|uniref:dTTP/UTP pyrophosphatase n=1 Tax=Gaopeijia maritima TaxID=3119007 RepID=A0ABU9EC98_9BACT